MKFGSLVTFVFPRSSIALQLLLLIVATVASTGTRFYTTGGPQQQQQQQQPSTHRAIPTAYTTSGGGFVTMTNSMGIIRAWHDAHILEDNTTHFGANSGGSWFQIQLSYSQEFYEAAIDLDGTTTVTDFVTEWGNRYGQKMKAATASGKLRKFTFALQESIPALCLLNELPDIDGKSFPEFVTNSLNGLLRGTMYPAEDWTYYVTEMLSSYIPNANTALWSAKRTGFSGGVISIVRAWSMFVIVIGVCCMLYDVCCMMHADIERWSNVCICTRRDDTTVPVHTIKITNLILTWIPADRYWNQATRLGALLIQLLFPRHRIFGSLLTVVFVSSLFLLLGSNVGTGYLFERSFFWIRKSRVVGFTGECNIAPNPVCLITRRGWGIVGFDSGRDGLGGVSKTRNFFWTGEAPIYDLTNSHFGRSVQRILIRCCLNRIADII